MTVSLSGLSGVEAISSISRVGRALLEAGRINEARQALELGVLLQEAGPPVAGISGSARFDLANLLHVQGNHAEAAAHYETLLALLPGHTEAHYNLGVTQLMRGRIAEAVASYRSALALDPSHANAHNNLGLLLESFVLDPQARFEALAHFRASGSAEARYNLALVLQEKGETGEASRIYQDLLAENPDHAEARNNLANIALAEGRTSHALEEYRRILAVYPDFADAHRNAAMAELILGNFISGFREYEWRFREQRPRSDDFAAPLWDGSPIPGKTLLIQAEQGLGDTIQFVRFLPAVAALAGKVILEAQRPLAELLSSVDGVSEVIPRGDRLPPHDFYCPLMSLPHRLQTTLDDLPAMVPYLSPGRARIAYWRKRIDSIAGDDELRIGLAWSGSPHYKNNVLRSVPPRMLEMLSELVGVRWFALQKDQSGTRIAGLELEWLERSETSFTDAAAIISSLDLVISVDTSIAHLAGALARPVWLLTSYAPDWRWMRDREDSPWYPTMRLFRQQHAGEWRPILERVRRHLIALLGQP